MMRWMRVWTFDQNVSSMVTSSHFGLVSQSLGVFRLIALIGKVVEHVAMVRRRVVRNGVWVIGWLLVAVVHLGFVAWGFVVRSGGDVELRWGMIALAVKAKYLFQGSSVFGDCVATGMFWRVIIRLGFMISWFRWMVFWLRFMIGWFWWMIFWFGLMIFRLRGMVFRLRFVISWLWRMVFRFRFMISWLRRMVIRFWLVISRFRGMVIWLRFMISWLRWVVLRSWLMIFRFGWMVFWSWFMIFWLRWMIIRLVHHVISRLRSDVQ